MNQAVPKLLFRDSVVTSWSQLDRELRRLPQDSYKFPPLKMSDLPTWQTETHFAENEYDFQEEDHLEVPQLRGETYFSVQEGQDVTIYTEDKSSRPWIGRVIKIYSDKREFDVQWLTRVGKSNRYLLAELDGSPHIDRLEEDTVMFTEMR